MGMRPVPFFIYKKVLPFDQGREAVSPPVYAIPRAVW